MVLFHTKKAVVRWEMDNDRKQNAFPVDKKFFIKKEEDTFLDSSETSEKNTKN